MILSVSRRTDIPAWYSDWFFNRIREGFLDVRNPMNPHQISRIRLSPEVVDCIVFWTKNPEPMLKRLKELEDYTYYFQFTLTGYGKDIETKLPDKERVLIPVFQELSSRIGKEKVIWRYDPILFSSGYSAEDHLRIFEKYSAFLSGYTEKCVISFVDFYAKNKKSMAALGIEEISREKRISFAKEIARIAQANNIAVASCAEDINLEDCGIEHNHCVDKDLIERLTGYGLRVGKDKGQRAECGCAESVETGAYNTCRNGCKYCYANHSPALVQASCRLYDPASPLLCSEPLGLKDKISERRMVSLRGEPLNVPGQMSLFDLPGGGK